MLPIADNLSWSYWFVGLCDGEASFTYEIRKHMRCVRPRFFLCRQRDDDLIHEIAKKFPLLAYRKRGLGNCVLRVLRVLRVPGLPLRENRDANANGVGIIQPRVGRDGYLGNAPHHGANPAGVEANRAGGDATLSGLARRVDREPKVARGAQPWAG